MNQPIQPSADPQRVNEIMNIAALQRRVKNGAANFYWVAGLSLINTLIYLFSSDSSIVFVVGLGITQFIDGIAYGLAQYWPDYAVLLRGVGFVFDLVAAGMLVLFGYFAGRGRKWAFITGMVLYALDSILVIVFKDVMAFVFHLLFLWFLFNGLAALNQLVKVIPQTASDPSFPQNIGG